MQAILRLRAVEARTGLARSTIYERIRRNEFPAQVKLGARASGWIEAEVNAWVDSRIAESRKSDAEADSPQSRHSRRNNGREC
jgi:prophage regulatory protein